MRRPFLSATTITLCLALSAQQAPKPQKPMVVFKATTSIVLVNLSVKDAQGKLVKDLKAIRPHLGEIRKSGGREHLGVRARAREIEPRQ